MSFVAWIFLFGALAVVGPLIAHLLAKPRFKRIPFTMLRFLQTGHKESQSRRRFRDLLVLLLRCLIIVLIAMLFAGPRMLTAGSADDTANIYYLGLDNSTSMAYQDAGDTYFDRMVDSAVEYIRSADDNGLFNICALASGQWAKNLTKSLALMQVKRLKLCDNSAKADEFLSEIRRIEKKNDSDTKISVLIVSDFTPKILHRFIEVEKPLAVENIEYKTIASVDPVNNAAITEAHVNGFDENKLGIDVTIVNYSGQKQKRTLTAKTNDTESVPLDIELNPNQHRTFSVQINVDTNEEQEIFLPVELSLSKGDGLGADDKFYLAVSMPQQETVNVLLLGKSNEEMFLLKTAADTISSMGYYEIINVRSVLSSDFDPPLLKWADVVICSSITPALESAVKELKDFVTMGGRLIFFMTPRPDKKIMAKLYQARVLPVEPQKYIEKQAYIAPAPSGDGLLNLANQDSVIRSLQSYRLDNVTVSGFFQCSESPETVCRWQFQNGNGFVYSRRLGSGISMLINTSADDSMASLTRSSGCVAFCRYLLGSRKQISEHVFSSDQKVILPASTMEMKFAEAKKPVWVEICDGTKTQAAVVDSFLVPPKSGGIGWIKTLAKPIRCVGVNLPDAETDMTRPNDQAVANIMHRIFSPKTIQTLTASAVSTDRDYKPLWKIFAWIIIVLIVAEASLVNRMKR